MFVSDSTTADKVMREGGNHFIFLLPDLEKKLVSDFAVVNKVMRGGRREFFLSLVIPKNNQQHVINFKIPIS